MILCKWGDNLEDLDSYIKQLIEDGYIREDGSPIKCRCECRDFEMFDEYYCQFGLEEYKLKCNNCGEEVGHWSFGHWQV